MGLARKVRIVGLDYSGTARDIELIATTLTGAGYECDAFHPPRLGFFPRAIKKSGLHSLRRPRYWLNIFLENVESWWMPQGVKNVVIPNQEWFHRWSEALLPKIDAVWCKTREAERVFTHRGAETRFLGFTSADRYFNEVRDDRDLRAFLHVSGTSIWKGTLAVIEAWKRHPEWPPITIVSRTPDVSKVSLPANVRLLEEFVDEQTMAKLQNSSGIHVQPSEMEGYGHCLGEAMSAGAVVVTTDAAPMNELVNSSRGVLVGVARSERHNLGMRHYIDQADLEKSIDRVISIPDTELLAMGQGARNWFTRNRSDFEVRLLELVSELSS